MRKDTTLRPSSRGQTIHGMTECEWHHVDIMAIKTLSIWLNKKPANSLKDALAESRLQALKQNIQDALHFLKKTYLKSLRRRQKLHWYVVFGASSAGKTSLLANSGLDLVSTNRLPVEHIAPTSYCQWFFGKEALFIDTSGGLMLPDNIDTASLNLWKKFILLLHRARYGHPLDGAVLCVDLLDLQDKTFEQSRQYIDVLLHHIHAFPYPIPLYVLFTRCDRIQGFTEFFHALSTEEREQVCGITLPLIEQQDFAQQLDEQFNSFLLRLNHQILTTIQRERDLQKRARIRNFPLQLEAQKRTIVQLNNQLHSTKNPIKGIYFTSSQQEGVQSDALSPLLDTFGFPEPENTSDRPLQKNAFFIKNTLKKIIQDKNHALALAQTIPQKLQKPINSPLFYLIGACLFLIIMLLTLAGYFYNRQAISQVQATLNEYQHQQKTNPQENSLALLNTLQKSQSEVKNATNPFTGLIFHQANYLKIELNTLYQQALDSTFVPKVEKILETQLQTDIEKKSPEVFDTLRVYLMMADPSHRDIAIIKTWFAHHAQTTTPQENQFMKHLHNWLASALPTFKTDAGLVDSAREILQKISPKNIIYANLEKKYSADTNNISQNLLYSTKHFQTIFKQDIPAFAIQTLKNDAWVLGETVPESMLNPLVSQLTHEVQQLYVNHYVEFWTTQLSNQVVPRFNDLNQARLFARTFNTDHSPLLQLLDRVEKNLSPVATINEGKKAITQLTKTRELVTKNQKNEKINDATKKLITYLDKMVDAKNSTEAVFAATQKRMQNTDKDAISNLIKAAKTEPEPINNWFTQLALNTWQTMLQISQTHLNTLWQTEVLPVYRTDILNRYPIFKDATDKEIALSAFTNFFGPNGTIENFYKHNLSAFVDSRTLYWQWKTVDGLRLYIPQTTLEMFNRAALIHKMYFADNGKQPLVKFSLTPVNLDLMSDNFLLNLGDQSVSYSTDFRQPKHITWPDKKSDYAVLESEEAGKKTVFYEEKGNWAVFRLLARAHVASSNNPKLYQLEFNLDHHDVTYDLLADNPVNAFIPDILTAFRCPEKL